MFLVAFARQDNNRMEFVEQRCETSTFLEGMDSEISTEALAEMVNRSALMLSCSSAANTDH